MEICTQKDNSSDASSDTSTYDNDETTLTPKNIVEHAIEYHKEYNLCNADIVETIQLMLASRKYVLSNEMMHNKVDFAQANTLFLVGVAPTKLDKNDLQNLIFKNVVCESLI
jgi:hypothetical protein